MSAPKRIQTAFEKIAEGLYKLPTTGGYYSRIVVSGKEIRRSLKTRDYPLAKRRLAELRRDLQKLDNDAANITLADYLKTFLASSQHKSDSTREKFEMISKRIDTEWPAGTKQKLRDVKPSDVLQWLQKQRVRFASSTYNEYVQFIRRLFLAAVKDRIIPDSPAGDVVQAKRETPIRDTPTWEQFRAIVADIRSQRRNADSQESGDFCEFMGLSGLGNAEAGGLSRDDIDLAANRVRIYRHKTDTGFSIPIYPQLRPLLERLYKAAEKNPGGKLFVVTDIRKALGNACKRLGFPHFTQRSLRRSFITRAVELGIDFKAIAGMQGHKDGGVLIAKTYSHLRNEHLDRMAEKLSE
ncbi:MAG: tyrosine-type recombinase/integrase [Verrucomicrobiota bacterium]